MSTLQIQLLGTFQLSYDSEPVTGLHQVRLQSLLAYMLLHRQAPQIRQRLAFLFWPDSPEPQAFSNLRKLLSAMRSTIPDAETFLHIDAKIVQWRSTSPFVLDVAQFEQHSGDVERAAQRGDTTGVQAHLEAAVAQYAGDLLPDCHDDWLVPERERLRDRFLVALARLCDVAEGARDYRAAVRQATRLLRHDPLHEETYRRLMRLHALNDDRVSAVRTYHTCVATLRRELGVEPSPPTQEAYAQLLHLEPTSIAPSVRQDKRPRDALVGRRAEWQQLTVAWQQAAHGRAQFVLVGGEPGIGKSRLVEELAQWVAQQGFATAYARAYAAEGGLAYDPVSAWLRSEPLRRHLDTLDEIWLVEVARLAPDVRVQHPHLPLPPPLTESWQRRHFFEALARAVFSVPEPLLLVLDARPPAL
jgi:DNA-binding SARP family transcriptional activator